MSLFFKQEDEEDEEDDFIPDEIARDLEEDKKTDEDFSEGLDPLQDRSKQTEIEEAAERLDSDMAKKRRRKPARDIKVLNQHLEDIKSIKETGTETDGIYDRASRAKFKKISKANINIIFDKMVFLQVRRNLLTEQPYEEFIVDGKFRLGEGDSSQLIDVKKLQREYSELGSDSEFMNFLSGLYSRRFNGEVPKSMIDKATARQQYNRLISSVIVGDPSGGIVKQKEILTDLSRDLNRSLFVFTELEKAREVLSKQIDDLETLVDDDLEILIDRRLKALTLAYSTVQRKVAEYVTGKLSDTIPEKEDDVKTEESKPYRGGGSKLTEASRAMREAERKKLQFKKGEKGLTPRQLVQEAKEKVRVKIGDTPRRLTQNEIKEMLDALKSSQPEVLEEAKLEIQKEIEGQLETEKDRLSTIEGRLKIFNRYKPLLLESKDLVGKYTGKKDIFEEQVSLANKAKLAAMGIKEIEGILKKLNAENDKSMEEWLENAEETVIIEMTKEGKIGMGIGDTTLEEVRLVGELADRVNARFDSLQEQINVVKNKLKESDEE